MKKLALIFFTVAILKSIILFLIILTGEWLPNIHILLRWLIYFLALWFIDSITIEKIREIIKVSWIKFTIFLFGTHVLILPLTGSIFSIYNKLMGIQADSEVKASTIAFIGFISITLAISIINSINKTKRLKRTTANTRYISFG